MKKMMLFALALVLTCVTSFAQSNEVIKLRLSHYWAPGITEFNTAVVNKFMKENPNIQVTLDWAENDTYKTRFKTEMAANSMAEVVESWGSGWIEPYARGGKLLDLTDYLRTSPIGKTLSKVAFDPYTFDGKVYGAAFGASYKMMYYNKKIFAQYKVKVPTTWDEFKAAIKTFKANGVTPIGFGNKDKWPGSFLFTNIHNKLAPASLFDQAMAGKASFEDPSFVKAAVVCQELTDLGAFPEGFSSMASNEQQKAFQEGKAAMIFLGTWYINNLVNEAKTIQLDDVGVFDMPVIDAKASTPGYMQGGAGSEGYVITTSAKGPKEAAAKKLLAALLEEGYLNDLMNKSNFVPLKSPKVDDTKISKLFVDAVKLSSQGKVLGDAYHNRAAGGVADALNTTLQAMFVKIIPAADFGKLLEKRVREAQNQ